jgi:predicted nucleotidyltransferase
MASPSKEQDILKLILENSPMKEWHFTEITREAEVTKIVASKWLKKYVKNGLIKYSKQKGRFPFYTAGQNNPVYQTMKRIHALNELHESGLITNLLSQKKAKTIILFGSMSKGDWYKDSDIDIFVFGDLSEFKKNLYETRLKRFIELHIFENRTDLEEVRSGLLYNIINGYVIKGQVQDLLNDR